MYNKKNIQNSRIKNLEDNKLMIIIDHKEKLISPCDLKCTWSVENFYNEYYLYRLSYLQAFIYKEACKKLLEDYPGYTIENLKFIVCIVLIITIL